MASVIGIERSGEEAHITFGEYFRAGLSTTALTLVFGYFWLIWVK